MNQWCGLFDNTVGLATVGKYKQHTGSSWSYTNTNEVFTFSINGSYLSASKDGTVSLTTDETNAYWYIFAA